MSQDSRGFWGRRMENYSVDDVKVIMMVMIVGEDG
jgi:hypothetical protein